MLITYGSVCSGIEAASVAIEQLGLVPLWFSQFDPENDYSRGPDFPSEVLTHHWPHVPNLGDMTKLAAGVRSGEVLPVDVLIGGTPCQAFSVAGLRRGLDDSRGQLTLAFTDLADAIHEQTGSSVVWWENVPGVLSSKDNAFGCFIGALCGEDEELQPAGKRWSNAGCVFGPKRTVAWRVLDAQYFGVAQRRRRVFVIASSRDDVRPEEILFESEGVRRDTAPSREAGQEVTRTLSARTSAGGGFGTNFECAGGLQPDKWPAEIACTLNAAFGSKLGLGDQHINGGAPLFVPAYGTPGGVQPVGFRMVAFGEYSDDETASTMKARDYKDATDLSVIHGTVRRLTPTECERLQGFPDGHTDVLYHGKPAPDGHRYKALGNSMAVPVMCWIGRRLVRCNTRPTAS